MRWAELRRGALGGLCALALAGAGAGVAAAADAPKKPAHFEVTVLRASQEPGGIDPPAERLNKLLARRGFSFGSLRVVGSSRATLKLGEIGAAMTPNGREFRFRPLDRNDAGFLVAIDWGTTRGDFRMEPGVPLILGGQPHQGGQLMVVLELE
jgi:hypothetical protein